VLFFQGLGKLPGAVCRFWTLAFLVLALLAPLAAPALVFERWGARSNDPVRALMVGEHPAYTTAMKLNGGAGSLEIYQVEGTPPQALERLTAGYRALGAQVFCVSGPQLGWGLVLDGGRVIRLLVTNMGEHHTSMLFRMEQTEQEFARSQQAPVQPLPPDVPLYPGTRWTQSIDDEAANSTTATATVGADPVAVLRYYAETLPNAGWKPGLGPRDQASGIYVRGSELLVVNANSTGVRGQTVVIFLHKRLK
jgi:hypothetical protein